MIALSTCLASGCATDDAEHESTGGDVSTESMLVAETLRWSSHVTAEGITVGPAEDPDAFIVTSDLDVTFEVDAAGWVQYSGALIPCESSTRARPPSKIVSLGEDDVVRGHGSDVPDPSTLPAPMASTLAPAAAHVLADLAFPRQRYCGLHLLSARSDEGTLGMEDAPPELQHQTIVARGRYRAEPDSGWTEFECATDAPIGVLMDVEATWWVDGVPTDDHGALELRITRRLDTLFDGLDVDAFTPDACGRAMLANLFTTPALGIELRPMEHDLPSTARRVPSTGSSSIASARASASAPAQAPAGHGDVGREQLPLAGLKDDVDSATSPALGELDKPGHEGQDVIESLRGSPEHAHHSSSLQLRGPL